MLVYGQFFRDRLFVLRACLRLVLSRPSFVLRACQTWESGKPGVPKGVLDGYPETKILGVRYPASPG